ncbi:hypothetical protein L0156_26275 [bacterium]|nr:hypothetical protein [bacterium]
MQTKQQIKLRVGPDAITATEPEELVISFMKPDAMKIQENVIANFCHYVYFFRSEEAGIAWTTQNPEIFLLSLNEAFFLARSKNKHQYNEFFL